VWTFGLPSRFSAAVVESRRVSAEGIILEWRGALSDQEMAELIASHGGAPVRGWWDQIRPHSYGWVTARSSAGLLVGFVNLVTDGGDHAFLVDTKTRGSFQRKGIATDVVRFATDHARAAGCEWLHVDFGSQLRRFYLDACGFQPTDAGLIHLRPPANAR
jgi:GNAT superfamily N-acetyltransferase